tara:strand:+ start:134 stop:409 length:276 start_codon:yes stop_codon:yes gene_type:complete
MPVRRSQYLDGSVLLGLCESDSVYEQGMCRGYLIGLDDVVTVYDYGDKLSTSFCVPDTVKSSQLQKVVIKGLNDKPGELHLAAAGLVHNIF